MNSTKKRITLIDGNSLMFRSYYATAYVGNLMKTNSGIYTNALYGFCNMTHDLLHTEEYVFVAFDMGKQTFRHQQFEEYKGTRKPLPDELRMQIPLIKKYLDILNVKRSESLDYEADDLIASVANSVYDEFDEIRIITGDKDLLQLVNSKVTVCLTKKGINDLEEYNEVNFFEKFGINPSQITDYKGLVGDTSDNLPGIKGIGEKTAIKLLTEYKTLENIIENINDLKGKVKETFLENKEVGLRCKYLATLKTDIDLGFTGKDLKLNGYDLDELIKFYQEVEFNSLLKRITKKSVETTKSEIKIIDNPSTNIKDILKNDSYINVEVFGKNYYNGEFLGLSFVSSNHQVFFTNSVVQNNQDLRNYLESMEYEKKVFDYKLTYLVLRKHGINIQNVTFDLMIAAYLINPTYSSNDFKETSSHFIDSKIDYYDNIYGANTKMKVPDINIYAKYSIDKGLILSEIEQEVLKEIKKIDVLELLDVEMNLARTLALMEENGLKVDLKHLDKIGTALSEKISIIEKEIYESAGEVFNINSPKQLGEILFDKLHLPHGKKNKTGYSTSVDVLEKLSSDFGIARKVLDYRGLNKLITTYVNSIKELTDENDYIHPLYKQTETLTGRLSSIEPNIQNMPIRSEEGQVIREIFVSRFENGKIVSADYSQIELRVLAHMSKDEEMINSFNNGIDFHSQTASKLYDVDVNMVTKDMRRMAKAINFGIIYGMSAWGLSETINVSPLEANIYINKYFDTFKKAKEFLDKLVSDVKVDGYSKTIYNRRRYIPEAVNSNNNLRSFGERTAMNAPIQGSAADIIKIAMNKIQARIEKDNLKSIMIAQVHDELVFDCTNDEVEIMLELVKEEMENTIKLDVKLIAEAASGNNWAEAK